jgi:RHS repeat-associated protein
MTSEYGSSRLFEVAWRWIRRAILPLLLVFLVSSVPFTSAAHAAPGASLTAKPDRSVDVTAVKPRKATPSQSEKELWSPAPVRWPSPGKASVAIGRTGRSAVAGQPVKIGRAAAAAPASAAPAESTAAEVTSEVLSRAASEAAGVSGLVVKLVRADETPAAAPVSVEIDYSAFRNAYGADWARRLQLVELPACAATTPKVAVCQQAKPVPAKNDLNRSALVADVSVAPAADAAAASDGTVLAVTAAAANANTGTFAKSSLADSASWVAGSASGDFAWSYDMEVPPAPGGLEPDLALSYSSGAVDGRTNAESAQTSWIGEGWDLNPGYIERQFRACKDDVTGATAAQYTNATDDLCYRDQNATLVMDGKSTELVRIGTTAKWRLAEDDGSTVELLTTGTVTGLHGNEHWKLTTSDGTQYWFGKTRLPGWVADNPVTESVWGVPVFHNRSNEPCYRTGGFAGSNCQMAWRWNLDYVVDPHGNSMSYWYVKEKSNTKLAGTTTVRTYERGGFLQRIDYGTRSGSELSSPAPMKVVFTEAERCLADCVSNGVPVFANYPDTPLDLQCNAGPCNNNPTPSFFIGRRLSKIATFVRVGTSDQPVDEWTMTHTFPATNEYLVDPSLWLASITHTGKAGGSKALPVTTFGGTRYGNRTDYNYSAAVPIVNKYRLTKITTPTGGEISVSYEGSDCTVSSQANPDVNTKRCFPQYYTPPDTAPGWSWWNKYRVQQVTERDLVGGSPTVVHSYEYALNGNNTSVLWHHNDAAKWALPLPKRSWSDWRGYNTVRVYTGATGGPRTRTDYRYFRGMHADRTDAGETARSVTVADSHGAGFPDHNNLAGKLLEVVHYDANHTTVLSKTRYQPWRSRTAQRTDHVDHVQPHVAEAWLTDTFIEETFEYLAAGNTWREIETEWVLDPTYGQITTEIDRGLTSTGEDDVCTTTSYARNITAWLIDYPAERVTTTCAATPGPDDVLAAEQTYYDGSTTLGAAPTRGLDTLTKELAGYTGSTATWVTTGSATYDAYGRVRTQTDGEGHTVETIYTPATGGPVTAVAEKNAAGHTVTTTLNLRGDAVTETDANTKVTTAQYDPLGRLLKLWLPGRPTDQSPNTEHLYHVNGTTSPSSVETRELGPNGNQITSFDIYDGLDRLRQTQSTSPDGKRVIDDTRYDTRGLTVTESQLYNNASAPTATLVTFADADVPTQNRYTYDGAERPRLEELWSRGARKWFTDTTYDGDRVNTTPPAGDTATTVFVDGRGNPTRLRQYKAATPTGDYDETTYRYDRLDRLTTITDPAGNPWTRSYDRRGRLTATTDPDTGTTSYDYDNADRLITSTDSRGETLTRTYDALDRITSLRDDTPDGPLRASWTYDTVAAGHPSSATRHHDGKQYTTTVTGYSDLYDPTGVTVTIPDGHPELTGAYTADYSYRADGSVATMTYPAVGNLPQETVTATYTAAGYLTKLQGADTYLSSAAYDWTGAVKDRRLGADGKRARIITETDEATFRLTKAQVHTERPGTPDTWDEKLTEHYRYDPAGNVTAITETDPAGAVVTQQCFQTDYLRRLTEAWTTTATACQTTPAQTSVGGPDPYWHSYTYDAVGNRRTGTIHTAAGDTVHDYLTPAAGQNQPHTLTRKETRGGGPATDYTYDLAGNLKTRTTGTSTDTFTFDAEGLLTAVTTPAGTHSYLYDAGGTRLLTTDPAATTLELGHSELRRTTTGAVTATRYYGDAVRTTDAGLTWITTDHHGTGQLAIDATTLATVRRRTTPFGEPRGATPIWPDRKGFVGGTTDPTGLTHLGARHYDASTGRFISPDPLIVYSDPQTMHGYAYGNNNPVTYTDPDGLIRRYEGQGGGGGGGPPIDYSGAIRGAGSAIKKGVKSVWRHIKPKPKGKPQWKEPGISRAQARQHSEYRRAGRADIQAIKNRNNAKLRADAKKNAPKGRKPSNGPKKKGEQNRPASQKSNKKPKPVLQKSLPPKHKPSGGKNGPKRNPKGYQNERRNPEGKNLPKRTEDNTKAAQDAQTKITGEGLDDLGTDVFSYGSSLLEGAVAPAQAGTAVPRVPHPHIKGPSGGFEPGTEWFLAPYTVIWSILRVVSRFWRK